MFQKMSQGGWGKAVTQSPLAGTDRAVKCQGLQLQPGPMAEPELEAAPETRGGLGSGVSHVSVDIVWVADAAHLQREF